MRRTLLTLLLLAATVSAGAQARWTVDPKPILDLKGVDDAGNVVFGTASWATRLRNGTIVIADASGPAVHFIDAKGKLVRSNGRSGQGPGDFRTVTWVSQCGEGIVYAWDFAQMRITTYDDAGTMKTTLPFGIRGGAQTFTSCNRKGMLMAVSAPRRLPPPAPPEPGATYGIISIAITPVIMSTGGDTLARLPEVPFGEILSGMNGRGGGGMPRPLGATTSYALGADRAYVGVTDSGAVATYSLDGKRTGTISIGLPARAPTREQYEHAADITLGMVPAQMRAQARTWVLGIPMPAKAPSFTGLFVDPTGLLWAVTSLPGDRDTQFRVFGTDGRAVATVSVPANLNVFEVGNDYILGGRVDANEEPFVTVYRLTRAGIR
jgi:hypothetical protein